MRPPRERCLRGNRDESKVENLIIGHSEVKCGEKPRVNRALQYNKIKAPQTELRRDDREHHRVRA